MQKYKNKIKSFLLKIKEKTLDLKNCRDELKIQKEKNQKLEEELIEIKTELEKSYNRLLSITSI